MSTNELQCQLQQFTPLQLSAASHYATLCGS